MTFNAYRARTATATLALLAGGYLAMSGTTAEPAAAESSEAQKSGESVHPWPGATQVVPGEDQADAQDEGAESEEKTADTAAEPKASKTQKDRRTRRARWCKTLSDPIRSTKPTTMPRGRSTSTARRVAVEPPRPPIEIGRQQYTSGGYDESSTLLGERIRCSRASPSTATGGRRSPTTKTTVRRYCPVRDPAEPRRRLQDQRHRTHTRLLHAASERQ